MIFGEKNFSFGSDIVEYARGKHFALPQLNEVFSLKYHLTSIRFLH